MTVKRAFEAAGALWLHKKTDGTVHLSGNIELPYGLVLRIACHPNVKKTKDRQPDLIVYLKTSDMDILEFELEPVHEEDANVAHPF